MSDEVYIKQIARMNVMELLETVMAYPEYLTDSYYRKFGNAIRARYEELRGA
jgi:hypothetical protein